MKKETKQQKRRMDKAAETMDRLANKFGKWDGVGIIRRLRDERTWAK